MTIGVTGVLTGLTGGEIYFHPRFDPVRDGRTVRAEMKGLVERETACSVTMRIRCSNGKSYLCQAYHSSARLSSQDYGYRITLATFSSAM